MSQAAEALIIQDNGSREGLNSVLRKAFCDLRPSAFHQNLIKIPHIKTIITTNYDDLIEQAYTLPYFQVIANDEELAGADWHNVQLLKIHGDLSHLDKIVITDTDYRDFIKNEHGSLLWGRIMTEFTTKHVVFVGYSAEDENILDLIGAVREATKKKVKKAFLIAPSLKPIQKKRLEQLGIEFVQGYGDEFLEAAYSGLKDSFGEDKYNQVCSQDTLARFGLICDVKFCFENNGLHTSIKGWKGIEGKPSSMQMHFQSPDRNFFSRKPSINALEMIKGFSFPMYPLTPQELSSFEMRINGIRINGNEELQAVYVGPAIKDETIVISSVSKGFSCKAKSKMYTDQGRIHVCIPTPLYNLEIVLDTSSLPDDQLKGNIHIKLNEGSFSDLDKATKWARLLTLWTDCSDLAIQIGKCVLEPIDIKNDTAAGLLYSDWLSYCLNLEEIERISGHCFLLYEPLSRDVLTRSKVVKSFLKNESFVDCPSAEYKELNYEVDKGILLDGIYTIQLTRPINGSIHLCGKDYIIPEERVVIQQCSVISCVPVSDEIDAVQFKNLTGKILYSYGTGTSDSKDNNG